MSDWKVITGDCLEVLRTIPAGSVDLVMTDPPYSSGGQFRGDRTASTASKYLGSYNGTTAGKLPEVVGDSRDSLGWAFWAHLWLTRCHEVSRDGAYLVTFCDWRQLPNCTNVMQSAGWVLRGIAAWDKGGSVRPMSGRYAHQCEFAPWGTKGAIGWDYERPSLPGYFRSNVVPSSEREHQTEKPVDVVAEMIGIVDRGATILDPFAGSGTTGVACAQTGRNFIGIEIDPHYADIARRRIAEAANTLWTPKPTEHQGEMFAKENAP